MRGLYKKAPEYWGLFYRLRQKYLLQVLVHEKHALDFAGPLKDLHVYGLRLFRVI